MILGEVIKTDLPLRDAVHIAVASVKAVEQLNPGQHVGVQLGEAASWYKPHIGIVDPFRRVSIEAGERFLICLYPDSVTGMVHHWVHPNFVESDTTISRQIAYEELDRKAKSLSPYWDRNSLIDLATNFWQQGQFYCGNYEEYDFQEHYPEIRQLLAHIGIQVPPIKSDQYFSCGC